MSMYSSNTYYLGYSVRLQEAENELASQPLIKMDDWFFLANFSYVGASIQSINILSVGLSVGLQKKEM